MKREIKFRGRISQALENAGFWVYWGISGTDMIDAIDHDTIGQYTGLHDRNGVEIYEGDILDFDESEWGGKFKPEVIDFGGLLGEWSYRGSVDDVSIWRKVIGNIYENSDLQASDG